MSAEVSTDTVRGTERFDTKSFGGMKREPVCECDCECECCCPFVHGPGATRRVRWRMQAVLYYRPHTYRAVRLSLDVQTVL